MARKFYPTDLSERQWHILKPLIPPPKASGRPRTVDIREIVNALFYIHKARLCLAIDAPRQAPPWATVYYYFRLWRRDGVWQQMHYSCR